MPEEGESPAQQVATWQVPGLAQVPKGCQLQPLTEVPCLPLRPATVAWRVPQMAWPVLELAQAP